jgi:hypothetical protein
MKKLIGLHLVIFVFRLPAWTQTGDFQLPGKNGQQRQFETLSADPDLKGNGIKKILVGKNYRQEWIDTIKVPVLNFKTDFGGLKPKKEGGGKQTHTLHIEDAAGREWVLRSVKKYPEKVIAPELKGSVAEDIINDGISGAYPYTVLSIGILAKSAKVPYLPNALVYIPDDPKLGEFRSKFKNSLAFLELRSISSKNSKEEKMLDTEELIPELFKSNNKKVDQKAVLRARLLDNFIMDFDRYDGQWLWSETKSGETSLYYPIPKDRDQALFKAGGFVPELLAQTPALGVLQGLRKNAKDITTFNYSSRDFDRTFLNELDEQTWSDEIDQFLLSMTDAIIEEALSRQPKEIQKDQSKHIIEVLKAKRSYFKKDMMQYYRFLAGTVSIIGSNEAEQFIITQNADGSTLVQVNTLEKASKGSLVYKRLFNTNNTKELRLYGLEGDDEFLIKGDNSEVRIRLIGGPGNDNFINEGNGGNIIAYDIISESNTVTGNRIKNKISNDPLNNEYRRLGTTYKSSSLGLALEYSRDGGLFLGPTLKITTPGFRKEPYASKHFFYATRALSSASYHLRYEADFMRIANNTDILVRSDLRLPTVRTNFFGFGNDTYFDRSKDLEYYHAYYTLAEVSAMARHHLTSWLQLKYGPALQYFKLTQSRNGDKYFNSVYSVEENKNDLYKGQLYAGAEVKAEVNTRNNDVIPTQGIYANIYTRPLYGVNRNSAFLNQAGAVISFYTGKIFKDHIILATSFGANRNFGDFEFPQAQYLGLKQNLRGFKFQRFAGRSNAYNNTELRLNFGDVNFYLFKGPFGLIGFQDLGRIWTDNEKSNTWHKGYGGGVWLAPFNKMVVAATIATSKEEKAYPHVNIGFQF